VLPAHFLAERNELVEQLQVRRPLEALEHLRSVVQFISEQ
jgi:hypothetical protein